MALASSWTRLSQVRRGRPGGRIQSAMVSCRRDYSPSDVWQYLLGLPGPRVQRDRIGTSDDDVGCCWLLARLISGQLYIGDIVIAYIVIARHNRQSLFCPSCVLSHTLECNSCFFSVLFYWLPQNFTFVKCVKSDLCGWYFVELFTL